MLKNGEGNVFYSNKRIGQDSYNKNEFQEAIDFIDRALSINPRSDVYWNRKGISFKLSVLGGALN